MANIWYIQVNRHCNNSCHFCSNPSNGTNISYEKWIELIDDFVEREYKWIIFTWWEPTLSPDLPRWFSYTRERGIENKMISNGMMCSDPDFMKRLADAGLQSVHFSVFSCHEKVHDFLSNTPGSWKKLMMSITNALSYGVEVRINTVINHYNQNHLDTTIRFLTRHFPPLRHFIWNNLDPFMMRKTSTAYSTLPDFQIVSPSLIRALNFLETTDRTFRVESLPLCFMRWYEYAATETRKIVKDEERLVHFLDFREVSHQKSSWFLHNKMPECSDCDLNKICWWIYDPEGAYKYVQVVPQKLTLQEKEDIVNTIKNW